jgi:RNA polymerase sigma-70 factor (ECF subfamily)
MHAATGTAGVANAPDEILLAAYASGDRDAALTFVRRFQARAYGLAVAITGDSAAAEEVAQDAFVRAWRYGGSYDPRRGSVAGWLLGIVRNVALDHLRATGRHRTHPLDDIVLFDDVDTGELITRRDDAARAVAAMRLLPPEQREALVAVTLRGLSAREYSEQANLPLGTVKTRVRLGLRNLRDQLGVQVS